MNQTAASALPTADLTQALAIQAGYTSAFIADCGMHTLELLIEPHADLDSTFVAYDRDENTWLKINGWLFDFSAD
jgi:hypothetical protein